jgi:hypothetical protein
LVRPWNDLSPRRLSDQRDTYLRLGRRIMKNLLLAAALIAGSLTLVGNITPLFAQGGGAGAGGGGGTGAGGDVSTPSKSVPRVGVDKRDDSMNAGQRRHVRHKKYTKHRRT